VSGSNGHTEGKAAMLLRFVLLVMGLSLVATGFGLTVAFGIFAFIGMPLLAIGLGLVTTALDHQPR
jgi:hypothetical protein